MQIITTEPWAGHDFSYAPGEMVDVPDEVGEARVLAGLAVLPPAAPDAPPTPRKRGGTV